MKSSSTEIARRYVDALFDLADKAKALPAVEKDLAELARLVKEDENLRAFLDNPLYNREQQKTVLLAIAKQGSLHALVSGLLTAMADQRRLSLTKEVYTQFALKAEAARGELSAEVVSASKLNTDQQKAVAERLGKAYGKKVNLEARYDEKLIGGMIVKIGSKQLDGSLAGKLNRLNIALKAA